MTFGEFFGLRLGVCGTRVCRLEASGRAAAEGAGHPAAAIQRRTGRRKCISNRTITRGDRVRCAVGQHGAESRKLRIVASTTRAKVRGKAAPNLPCRSRNRRNGQHGVSGFA